MNEFSMIEKYFLPLTQNRKDALGLKDDAAVFSVSAEYDLVVTSDTLAAGTHFLKSEKPEFIAHKSLRVNLSDLAAMGAKPYAYQLCIAFPAKPREPWVNDFTAALRRDQKKFGIFCSGGDTTRTRGPLNITITAFGLVPKGAAVKRSGAKPEDALVITGPVGDALIGLRVLQKKIRSPNLQTCIEAYRKPVPRTNAVNAIRRYAHAAIDISDGLVADTGHICKASNCGVRIDWPGIKFSRTAQKLVEGKKIAAADLLTGGDDYELALAVPQESLSALLRALKKENMKPQVIGRFVQGPPVVNIYNANGRKIRMKKTGWTHF